MQALNEWVGNIVIFILVAVILELLVPNTQLQKYVKMVVGLLLILLLLSPLLKIFSIEPEQIFESMKTEQTVSKDILEKNMNKQKNEIQAAQSAYIEEQMAVQLKRQVEEELMKRYELTIEQLAIQFDSDLHQNDVNIRSIHVVLNNSNDNHVKKVERVKKVKVRSERNQRLQENTENQREQDVKAFFSREMGNRTEKTHY